MMLWMLVFINVVTEKDRITDSRLDILHSYIETLGDEMPRESRINYSLEMYVPRNRTSRLCGRSKIKINIELEE